jgi:hypothetical protein
MNMTLTAAQKENGFSITLTIRDKDHFKKVINWLNDNIGKGREHWTCTGKVLRKLQYGRSVTTKFHFVDEGASKQVASFVALL